MHKLTTIIGAFFLICFSTFSNSCSTYKLTESDLEWQPYRKGDLLVFKSNFGEIDTIIVRSIETYKNPDDPLAILPNNMQSIFVNGKQNILEIDAGKKESYIHFTLKLGDKYLKYPNIVKSIKELDKEKSKQNKIVAIEAKEYYDNLKELDFDLKNIYWSKEYGYIKLEFKNEYYWELQSFIRNGKNLIENKILLVTNAIANAGMRVR
jgi:hypothetical protein